MGGWMVGERRTEVKVKILPVANRARLPLVGEEAEG